MAAMLHDLDVSNDKQDSRSLYISAKFTTIGPMVNTKFIFDDSIRCMAAQQRYDKLLQQKLFYLDHYIFTFTYLL